MFDYIYENDCYQFNKKMINQIIFDKGNEGLKEELETAHLTTTRERKDLEEIKNYIEKNINEYIEKVFLKIENNTEESMGTIIWLLNNDDISGENKIEVIRKENQKIDNITKVNNSELWSEIVEHNRITVSWENLFIYHENGNSDDDILFNYLNEESNYNILSESKINTFKDELEEKRAEIVSFSKKILSSEKINDIAYEYLIKSIPYWYSSLELSNLSIEKVNLLLENEKLQVTQKNIEALKKKEERQHIILIENFIEDYLKNFDNIELEREDYIELLKSKKLEVSHKLQIFENIDRTLIEDFIDEFIGIVIGNRASEDNLFDLLNIEDLSKENKIKIIEDVDEIIDDIKNVKDCTLWSEIMKNNKLKACWGNVSAIYSSEDLDENILVEYLNKEKHFKVLSEQVFKNEEEYDLDGFILKSNKINDIAYSFLAETFGAKYEILDISKLSISKINTLFKCELLAMNGEIIDDLKQEFPDKHIEFIEKNIEEYLGNFDRINLDNDDYTKLLKSKELKEREKLEIIKNLDMQTLNGNNYLIFEICNIYIENPEEIDEGLSKILLELLIAQIKYLSKNEINNYIGLAGEEYKGISPLEGGTVVHIQNTEKNEKLAKELEERKYISSFSINKNNEIKVNKFRGKRRL
ncbi:MAG: hypothetical protein WBG30_01620 [Psychrilyobacter sp.]|uniref:hypothetical protein n=1 Tax=Psychrilyobacter sp. TaxID=2586924 RepID=UPI003C723E17